MPGGSDEQVLARLQRHKQRQHPQAAALGTELLSFFKSSIQKRQTKLTAIAEAWIKLVPPNLVDHTCLEGFSAGALKVLVDSSSHLYDLKHLLLAGLQQQLVLACKAQGLRKINVKLGRWYTGEDQNRRITF